MENDIAIVVPGLKTDIIHTSEVSKEMKSCKESVRTNVYNVRTKREDFQKSNKKSQKGDWTGRRSSGKRDRVRKYNGRWPKERERPGKGEFPDSKSRHEDEGMLKYQLKRGDD